MSLKSFRLNTFDIVYTCFFLSLVFPLFLKPDIHSNHLTHFLSFFIGFTVLIFMLFNRSNISPLTSYISVLYSVFVIPRLLMLSYMPNAVKFPFAEVTVDQVNNGLVIFLFSTIMLYFGLLYGAKLWPPSKEEKINKEISLKSIVSFFIISCIVEIFLNHFIGLSPYLNSRDSSIYNNLFQLLRASFSIDFAVFVSLILFFGNEQRLKSKKWLIFTCISVILFLVNTSISGSRGATFRLLMEFLAIYIVVKKTVNLRKNVVFVFLAFILVSSPVTYSIGNVARNIMVLGGYSEKLLTHEVFDEQANSADSSKINVGFLPSVENILNRLCIVDYAILLPYVPRDEIALKKYITVEYIIKSSINSILPGSPYSEASLSTSRAINIIYRGYLEEFVSLHGYFSEFWTSFALFFLMFGLLSIPLHFFIGLFLQFSYSYFSKIKSNISSLMGIYYLFSVPSLILFTMGIDHTVLTFTVAYIQLFTFIIIYKILNTFFNRINNKFNTGR